MYFGTSHILLPLQDTFVVEGFVSFQVEVRAAVHGSGIEDAHKVVPLRSIRLHWSSWA